jgi:eukaryotic-like serine/threonine-protein kinase
MDATPEAIGRYLVLRQLGQGAMGRVLLAKDPVLDREVAIKLLRDDLKIPAEQKAGLVKRMRQEARASARVTHPNIVALHDMGEDAELGLYLVFEYAEGTTLKQRVSHGPLDAARAARLAREIGSALTTAHRAGVLHRDIKPDNIILSATGAKIADFGIARVPDSTLTRDGGLLGTPAYSSPESIAHGTFSPLSDQFSMAATLYEAIAGVRAFPGQDAVAVATKIATEDPLPIAASRGFAGRVDEVLSRALSKQPEQRFASALEFGEAVADALEAEADRRRSMATIPDQRHQVVAPNAQRSAWRALLGGAALGALLTMAGFQLSTEFGSDKFQQQTDSSPAARTVIAPTPASQPPRPIGWLAESPPKPRPKHSRPKDSNDDVVTASETGVSTPEGKTARKELKPGEAPLNSAPIGTRQRSDGGPGKGE